MDSYSQGRKNMSSVSLAQIRENSVRSMKQATEEALSLIGLSFSNKIKNVVIKANLCYYWDYSTGQTTDPRFTAGLIQLIREKTANDVDISIVESDASAMRCNYAFRMLGYEKLAKDHNVRLVNLSAHSYDKTRVMAGGQSFEIMVPHIIQKADLKINVPKIKYTMEKIELTCALKNIFGCNPYPKKFKYHPRLGEAIIAMNKAMKFDLHIIDGNIVSGIQPRRLGLVMASKDPVAIDFAAAKIAGMNPNRIKYLQLASKEGLGNKSFIPRGIPINYFKERYPKKNINKKLMAKAYSLATRAGLTKMIGV